MALPLVAATLLAPSPAHAYIDFGAGSYAFQLLIAWILAVGFGFKVFWGRIIAFVRRLLKK